MGQRINIVLAPETIQRIDGMVPSGGRSKFIEEAVIYFIENRSREALRKRLEFCAIRDQDLGLEVMAEWAAVDEETWRRIDLDTDSVIKPRKQTRRVAVKSTSRRSTRP